MQREPETSRRPFVSFSFHRVLPEWRRLPSEERAEHRREFAEVVHRWCRPDQMRVVPSSVVGLHAGAELMLWRICYSLDCLQNMAADVLATRLGGYLETPFSYLSMTRQSAYVIDEEPQTSMLRGVVRPGGSRYLFVHPLVRSRNWYLLPFEDRQRAINEVLEIYKEFPLDHVHVTYSFGLDSQDVVVAIETHRPEVLVEGTMRLREAESSGFILSDTPVFSCVKASLEDALARLG